MCTHHSRGNNAGFQKFVRDFLLALQKAVNTYDSMYDKKSLTQTMVDLHECCHDFLIISFYALRDIRLITLGEPISKFQDLDFGDNPITCDGNLISLDFCWLILNSLQTHPRSLSYEDDFIPYSSLRRCP